MDMRAMEFPDGTFDCVIDKATLDSVLVKKKKFKKKKKKYKKKKKKKYKTKKKKKKLI